MLNAIFALVGVVIGAAATGLTDVLVERHRQRQTLRLASRTLAAQLAGTDGLVQHLRDRHEWLKPPIKDDIPGTWEQLATAFATLSFDEWTQIEDAVESAKWLNAYVGRAPDGSPLTPEDLAFLDRASADFERAGDVLHRYS